MERKNCMMVQVLKIIILIKGWCVPIHLKVRDLYDMSDRYTSGYVSEAFQSQHLPVEDDRPILYYQDQVSRQNLIN